MTAPKPPPQIIDPDDTAFLILGAYVDKEKRIAAEKAAAEAAAEAAEKAKQAALNQPPPV